MNRLHLPHNGVFILGWISGNSQHPSGPLFLGIDPHALSVPACATALEVIKQTKLAGEKITAVRTRAPGNDAPLGGVKVQTASGWFD